MMHIFWICCLLLTLITAFAPDAFALRKMKASSETHLRNALTHPSWANQPVKDQVQPEPELISLANAAQYNNANTAGPRGFRLPEHPKRDKHSQGIGLLIAGAACLTAGFVFVYIATQPGGSYIELLGGMGMLAAGLAFGIPGLVLTLKYPPRRHKAAIP